MVRVCLLAVAVCACSCHPEPPESPRPRFPGAWSEPLLCPDDATLALRVVDAAQRPVADAEVWTEALVRSGGSGFGEIYGHDEDVHGPITRTDANGVARVCDVTVQLHREYGTAGRQESSYLGSYWLSLIGVDLFVQRDGSYVRASRYESFAFGTGTRFEPPSVVTFADATPVEKTGRPAMLRPSARQSASTPR